ncbi:hypothetical protein [Salinactinospora qingdaonensis]|uniref:Uncharacterized protein n=1 Tax=Salinactinospora qingdaonensis TaxID=702744 RepID=A0ABP7FHG3_9ACTN
MTTRDVEALHGPWADDEDNILARLRLTYGRYRWRIWRAVREDRSLGDWCARHTDTGADITAATPEELQQALAEAAQ